MQYKTIDLCAGIGGIRRGFELAGDFKTVASAEIDEQACRTYEHLYGDDPRNDITSDKFKQHIRTLRYDVLMAGFPCQAFSSVGLRQGFKDKIKGTIFFDIAEIIEQTTPKVVFLENVENLVSHNKGSTFKTIIETLENDLGYKVIGVTTKADGSLQYNARSFVRNSKNFGIPQNRPRVYIVAFSRAYYGSRVDQLPDRLPEKSEKIIYEKLIDVLDLDKDIAARFFLSSVYLKTLEDHSVRQKEKGYGFGYCILNEPGKEHAVSNALLATGGSGRERNLIYDVRNGKKYAGCEVKGKYSPINNKCIRTMTPTEWGRLQGFIGYAFKNKDGRERFSFPENMPNVQQYQQFGNSVTIPVIETMAKFVLACVESMMQDFSQTEKRLYSMYGKDFLMCRKLYRRFGERIREDTLNTWFDIYFHFGLEKPFKNKDLAAFLGFTSARASQILSFLHAEGCVVKNADGSYTFSEQFLTVED